MMLCHRRILRLATSLLAVATAATSPVAAHAQGSRTFGRATFSAPAGWTETPAAGNLSFTRAQGRDLCMIAVAADDPAPGGLAAAFANSWAAIFSAAGMRTTANPVPRDTISPSGQKLIAADGDLEDRQRNRFLARLMVFPSGDRVQSVVWIANGPGARDRCRSDWEGFVGSLRVRGVEGDAPTVAPASPDNPAPPPPAIAEGTPQRLGNVTFTPPAGWRVQHEGELVVLTSTATRGMEFLQILVLPGLPSIPLEQAFATTWNEVRGLMGGEQMRTVNGTDYDLDGTIRSLRGWDYLTGDGGIRRRDGEYDVRPYVMRAGDRVERVAVLSKSYRANLLQVTTANATLHDRAIRSFLASLDFASMPEARSPSGRLTTTQSVSGVWNGLGMSFGAIKGQFAILFDDGTAYFGPRFPSEGLERIEPVAEQFAEPRYWGTWRASGGRGEITLPYGAIPLQVVGPTLELTTTNTLHKYIRRYMPARELLIGTWCLSDGKCLDLAANGRFRDSAAVRTMEHAADEYAATPVSGEGTYELRDYSLVLRYTSGLVFRMAFPGLLDSPTSVPAQVQWGSNLDVMTRK
jgi:hypothetical protein